MMIFRPSFSLLGLLVLLSACSPNAAGLPETVRESGMAAQPANAEKTESGKDGTGYDNSTPERPPSTVSFDPTCYWDGIGTLPRECEGAEPTHCAPGLVLLRNEQTGLVERCGCPAGTEEILEAASRKPTGCLCPSGARLMVIRETGEALACAERVGGGTSSNEVVELAHEEPLEVPEPECRTVMYGSDRTGFKPVLDCRTDEERLADERRKRAERIWEIEQSRKTLIPVKPLDLRLH